MTDLYLKPIRLLTRGHVHEGVDAGSIGVVMEVWADGSYEVEFSHPETGATIALLTLPESEIEPLDRSGSDQAARTGD